MWGPGTGCSGFMDCSSREGQGLEWIRLDWGHGLAVSPVAVGT
jgi:hypothetical protein